MKGLLKVVDSALEKGNTYKVALTIGRHFVGTYKGIVAKTLAFIDKEESTIYLDPNFIDWVKKTGR
ncbi:MAG: hypothetical protein ACP5HC_06450 [Caldisericum sp.]